MDLNAEDSSAPLFCRSGLAGRRKSHNYSSGIVPDFHTAGPLLTLAKSTLFVEVEVTLRPTVSRPVCLSVLPLLEQVTRRYIYLSVNYFLYFSCREPSLTRGRVCNLQCTASSISSYIATDGLSAISSWCRAPNGAHNQILISLFDSYFVFSV
jgi:hypothetical protein